MIKTVVEYSKNQTRTIELQNETAASSLVKKLRLKFESFQIPLDLSRIDTNLSNASSLGESVNHLLELFNQFDASMLSKLSNDADMSFQLSDEFYSIKEQLLEFLVKKLEFLNSKLKTSHSSDLISLVVLILQLIRKNYESKKLTPYYKNLIAFLRVIKDNKIINEVLNFWTSPALEINSIQEALLPILKKNLMNKDHRIRSKCLRILAFNFSAGDKLLNKKIIKILSNFVEDQDPRVRMTAFELMIVLHLNGILVPVEYYENIKKSLFDDYEKVRLLSTQLICLLAFSYPEYMVTLSDQMDDEKIRLADDAFSKICYMINDISLEVKVCASSLLGKINLVSARFLLQTLDKKLMSDLRLKKAAKLRQKQLVANEWLVSTQITSESSDSVITDEDNLNLMASGACGAFIHGLEDEFLEVRVESVDSLCNLAVGCPKLAAKSIDFLVDMFNDEIEMVRLKAILALTKILHYVLLGDDQIDIVVSVIEDSSFNVRESVKDLLSNCKLATKIGLKKTIQALFNNLRKYPIDKNSIWRCLKCLGKNHAKFVMSLVSYLVSLHPFIDVVEPDINDIYYVSSLILIFNGVNENSAILPLLPRYVISHYFFLKLKLPHLIPDIRLIENYPNSVSSLLEGKLSGNRQSEEIEMFFLKTKNSFKLINLAEDLNENKIKTYESLSQDIKYLSEIDSSISVACEIMKGFVDCCLIIKKKELLNNFKEKTDSQKLIQIEEGLLISIKLIVLYKGYNYKEKIILFKLYLYLRALYIKELYNRKNIYNNINNSFFNFNINSYLKINIRKDLVKECHLFLSLIQYFDKILDKNFKNLIYQIIKELPIEFNKAKQLEPYISNNNGNAPDTFDFDFLMLSDKPNNYQKLSLDLLEPVENLESPIRFTPGLVSAIKVKAVLKNFTRFDNLYIQVSYSDNDKQFIPIEMSSIKSIASDKHILDTIIYLSNLALTDSCSIKICITMLIDEYKSIRQNILENFDKNDILETETGAAENELNLSLNNSKNVKNNLNPIELSKFVKIYFEPLAKKFF